MHLTDYGLSFDSELSFGQMLERLNRLGPWQWRERDSAWYGNLASVRTDSLKIDLIESGGNEVGGSVDAGNGQRYSISVRVVRRNPPLAHEWAAVEASIKGELLPLIGATGVQPTDPID